jgi:hypothetical protein
LTELSKSFISTGDNGHYFKNRSLEDAKDMYLLTAERTYTIHDDLMHTITFHSVLELFVNIIMTPRFLLFDNKLKILNRQFILPITGNININTFIRNNCEEIQHIYGEDEPTEYIRYIKDELLDYFEFNSQASTLK